MNWKFGFKILTLTIALSATLFSIYLLNSQHANDFFTSLGFSSASKNLNWCTDRLKKAEGLNSEWSLEEKDRQWILQKNNTTTIVDYLDIEKWLARYCAVQITELANEKILDLNLQPFARLLFNDGGKVLIYQKDGKYFQLNEVTFESKEMSDAFSEIKNLLKIN
jgi:hypothetical protein